jgi:hypothetical protein
MVSLSKPSNEAAILLRKIVDKVPYDELRDFEKHNAGKGVGISISADGLSLLNELKDKGWLSQAKDFIFSGHVHLTHMAWQRYQIAEWSEVEESVLQEKRREDFGGW